MKMYGGVSVQTYFFLTSALVGGEWSASHSTRFTLAERAFGTIWIAGWVDPRAGVDDMEKLHFLTLTGLELRLHGRRGRSAVAIPTALPRLTSRKVGEEKSLPPAGNPNPMPWSLRPWPSQKRILLVKNK
jgi:hypothetical protein